MRTFVWSWGLLTPHLNLSACWTVQLKFNKKKSSFSPNTDQGRWFKPDFFGLFLFFKLFLAAPCSRSPSFTFGFESRWWICWWCHFMESELDTNINKYRIWTVKLSFLNINSVAADALTRPVSAPLKTAVTATSLCLCVSLSEAVSFVKSPNRLVVATFVSALDYVDVIHMHSSLQRPCSVQTCHCTRRPSSSDWHSVTASGVNFNSYKSLKQLNLKDLKTNLRNILKWIKLNCSAREQIYMNVAQFLKLFKNT